MNFKIYLQLSSKAMADRYKKRDGQEYKKLNISRIKIAFQMKKKAFFIVFGGLSFTEKIKI